MRLFTHYHMSHLASLPRRVPFKSAHLVELGMLNEGQDFGEPVALGRTDALTLVNRWNREQHASGWVFWIDGDEDH